MNELFLGARRPARARRLFRRGLLVAALVALIAVCAAVAFERATTYAEPSGAGAGGELEARDGKLWLEGASLERLGRLWVLRTRGTPWQLGVAQGRLLAPLLAAEPDPLDVALLGEREPEGWVARKLHRAGLRWRLRLLPDAMPRERREELGGISAGLRRAGLAHPTYQTLVRRQASPGLGAAPGLGLPIGGVASALSFARLDPGEGQVVLARTFHLRGAPAPQAVVGFTRAAGVLAYADVGWAGQVGVVSGVNAEAIAIFYTPAVTDDVRAATLRLPLALLTRQVLEQAKSMDEALAILAAGQGLGAGSFLVVDGETGERALVGKSPTRHAVKRVKADDDRPLWTGEGLVGSEFDKDAENARARRTLAARGRQERFAALLARAVPGPAGALGVLRDRQELPLGHPGAVLDLAAQHAVVIDARAMMLWVADGSAEGAWHGFDLRAELRGDPPRALAADEVRWPPDAAVDAADAARAGTALALGEEAARELRIGRRRAAREAAIRAIALAPALPEAYRVAATASAGVAAAELWRKYLAAGPVDPIGLEDARNAMAGP